MTKGRQHHIEEVCVGGNGKRYSISLNVRAKDNTKPQSFTIRNSRGDLIHKTVLVHELKACCVHCKKEVSMCKCERLYAGDWR